MRAITGFLLAVLITGHPPRLVGQAAPSDQACVDCHVKLENQRLAAPARNLEEDVHAARGFGCLECHGGATGRGPGSGFLGKPDRRQVAVLCGRCHSDAEFMRRFNPSLRVDQVAEYATSVHGRRLARENDSSVAVCVNCHPAHRIKPPSDPRSSIHPLNVAGTCAACHADSVRMAPYGIPTDQHAKYERSVHWEWMTKQADLSAPTCNDCHGNHGAAPPGISSVQNVCGQCHGVMMALFVGSSHADYFVERGFPGCATCHSNHEVERPGDQLLPVFGERVCGRCHLEGDSARYTFWTMKGLIDSLQGARERATAILSEAQNAGMEVSQAQVDLEDVTNALVKARAAIHAFTTDSLRQEVAGGLAVTAEAYGRGQEALHEYLFRRQGLAVSVGVILLLITGLVLKIRQLERSRAGQ